MEWPLANPLLLIPITLGVLYAIGLARWPQPRPLRPWAPYSFYGGLVLTIVALAGPLDALADDLFSMHMLQHMVLVMIGPPLMLLGAPTTPVLRGLPQAFRKAVVAPLMRSGVARTWWRFFSHPATIFTLFTVNLWLWHFYGHAYEMATQHLWIHVLEHWSMVLTAALFWGVVIDPNPLKSRLSYPLRLLFIGVTMLQKIAIGAFITYRHDVLYAYYAERPRLWGISALYDQQLAAMFMWIGGTMILMIVLVIVLAVWLDKEDKRVKEREAQEDARLAAARQG